MPKNWALDAMAILAGLLNSFSNTIETLDKWIFDLSVRKHFLISEHGL